MVDDTDEYYIATGYLIYNLVGLVMRSKFHHLLSFSPFLYIYNDDVLSKNFVLCLNVNNKGQIGGYSKKTTEVNLIIENK